MRQLRRRRLSAVKHLAPESVGRVVPALKNVLPYEHLGNKRFGGTSYLDYDQLHEDERASSKRNRGWSSCETSPPGEGAAHHTTGRKTLKV